MKIYVSHSLQYDYKNELYKPLRELGLNKTWDIFLPHETDMEINSKEQIKSSDFVLAEVSFSSTGQGIELGWAEMMNIPIICIYKEGGKASRWINILTNKVIVYKNAEDMITKIEEVLR